MPKKIKRYTIAKLGDMELPMTHETPVNNSNMHVFEKNMLQLPYCDLYLKKYNVEYLYYFSRIENFDNILKYGIISYNKVKNNKIDSTSFSEESVQKRRDRRDIYLSNNIKKNLHELVPLYFTTKTPTLYARGNIQDKIFFCRIDTSILSDEDIGLAFTDGNAASSLTQFHWNLRHFEKINWKIIFGQRWNETPDGKLATLCPTSRSSQP